MKTNQSWTRRLARVVVSAIVLLPAAAFGASIDAVVSEEPCGIRVRGVATLDPGKTILVNPGSTGMVKRGSQIRTASGFSDDYSGTDIAAVNTGGRDVQRWDAPVADTSGFRHISRAGFSTVKVPGITSFNELPHLPHSTVGSLWFDSSLWTGWEPHIYAADTVRTALFQGSFDELGIIPGVYSLVRYSTTGGTEYLRTTYTTANVGLSVVLDASPADGTTIDFATNLSAATQCQNVSLADAEGATGHTRDFTGLVGGTYTLKPTVPAGWVVGRADCTGSTPSASFDGTTMTVSLPSGSTTCTFGLHREDLDGDGLVGSDDRDEDGDGILDTKDADIDGDGVNNDLDPEPENPSIKGAFGSLHTAGLNVRKLTVRWSFKKPGHDSALAGGGMSLPADFALAGAAVSVDVAGERQTFTLGSRGLGKQGSDSFKLVLGKKLNADGTRPAKWTLALRKRTLAMSDAAGSAFGNGTPGTTDRHFAIAIDVAGAAPAHRSVVGTVAYSLKSDKGAVTNFKN